MKKIFFVLTLFCTSVSLAQLQNANWCFGFNARVNFNTVPPTLMTSQISQSNPGQHQVSASVSDNNGQLLFYTDGINVWDKNDVFMPHGDGTNGNGLYGYSDLQSTEQNVVIVPKPGYPNIYYIFTLGTIYYSPVSSSPLGRGGIHYSVVDMSLNGGNGDVVPSLKNIIIKDHTGNPIDYIFDYNATNTNPYFISQKSRITTSLHSDGDKIWVSIIADFYYNFQHTRWFYNFLVSQNGIAGATDGISPLPSVAIQLSASNYTTDDPYIAVMKISPNGQYLCDAEDVVNLYDYNNQSGTVSFNRTVYNSNIAGNGFHSTGYGLEFSPDNQLIYFTDNPDGIIQSGLRGSNKVDPPKNYVTLYQYYLQRQYLEAIYNYPSSGSTDLITSIDVQAPSELRINNNSEDAVLVPTYHQSIYSTEINNGLLQDGIVYEHEPLIISQYYDSKEKQEIEVINDYLLPSPKLTHLTTLLPITFPFGLQLGIDNKIYVSAYGNLQMYWNYLGVINSPNAQGTSCNFVPNGLQLSINTFNNCSMPQWIHKAIVTTPVSGQWTWIKGSNAAGQNGIFGTQGIPSISNNPGARHESISWKDASGDLWLFGGNGFYSSGQGFLNDLWKYNIGTSQWTWVKGDDAANQGGVYGSQGIPSLTNKPGGRRFSVSFIDANNLWLFGGYGYDATSSGGYLNDLWRYNIGTGEWTWIKGSNLVSEFGTYGSQGIPAISNKPGGRQSSASWSDGSGNLWLFGGDGFHSGSGGGMLNDLWKYNISSNQWTWVKGDNILNQPGVYGTQGIPSLSNKPGARNMMCSWNDGSGNLWVFGGNSALNGPLVLMNDLWKYNISSNQWTWVKGDNTINQVGIYGSQGISSISNKPGARIGAITWTDAFGNLWLFGGTGYDALGGQTGHLNDLWKYNIVTNEWTWVKGSDVVNETGLYYGIQGIPTPTTRPSSRWNSISWIDLSGDLWLFGGDGWSSSSPGYLNDLWRYH